MTCSTPSTVTSVPLYLPIKTLSPFLDFEGDHLSVIGHFAFAHSDHFGFLGFFLGRVGDDNSALPNFLFFYPLEKNTVV